MFEDRPDDPVTYEDLQDTFKGVPAHILRSALVGRFAGCSYNGCPKHLIYQGLSGAFSPAISRGVAQTIYLDVERRCGVRMQRVIDALSMRTAVR